MSKRDLERSVATSQSECKSLLLMPFCWVSKSPTFVDKKYLERDELRRDMLRVLVFYWKRGYREASVDTTITRVAEGAVRVTFDIREGPPTIISALRVEYDSTLMDERRVRRLSILRAGDPLNLVVLDTMRMLFELEMWNRGYADAQVDTIISVNDTERRAAVMLHVRPNWRTTIGTITVRGNEHVDVRTIQNSITLRPGEVFRYHDLAESQRNLYESNLFRLAMFSVPPRPDSVKDVNIEVRESRMREARIATGFNTVEFGQADASFTHYNVFGGARRLDVAGAVANLGASRLEGRGIFREMEQDGFFGDPGVFEQPTWQISGALRQPAFLRKPENALSLGGFAHRRAAPAVFVDRGYGGQLSFTRTLAPRATASTAYRFEITRVEASEVYYCVNYGVCDSTTIGSLRRHQRLSPVLLSAAVDRSDIAFTPTKGYVARLDLEHASSLTVSDYRFNRAFAEAAVYTHFRYPSRDPRAQVLAGRLRVGWVQPLGGDPLHPRKRFYAGGSQSVRGYGENELGPKILTIPSGRLFEADFACDTSSALAVSSCNPNAAELTNRDFTVRPVGGTSLLEANIEYRMPIGRKIEYAVFLDGALVGGSAIGDLTTSLQLPRYTAALTPGGGFRYKSPVGPIRVDLGYNPRATERVPVMTTAGSDTVPGRRLVTLQTTRSHTSGGNARGFWSIFNRLVLHLSIGQAF